MFLFCLQSTNSIGTFTHDRNPNNIPTLYICEVEIAAEGLAGVQQLLSNPVGQNVKFVFAAVRTEP